MNNNINFIKCSSYEELSKKTANDFITVIKNKPNSVLGLATGSSPMGVYKELIKAYENKEISFRDCVSFNLDEYIGLKKEYEDQTYKYFMNDNLFSKIDINKDNTFFPIDAFSTNMNQDFESYDSKIDSYNGLDILILGIGNNGHIGFNEPGSLIDSKTRMIDLTESTIKANSRFFKSENDVPRKSVTMGLSTILKAKKIVLVVVGDSKKEALNALMNSKSFDSNWPCTALVNHDNVVVYYIG
ncbi:glucosamine-6-phosphate deaminase [Malacoplasma penetrans]|uniref:Glucosamine-6-phosphate deaminase n=1 Tax=Malacoplasma penetrans (strain HF-2) TaxID=272633 RepID=NAGB_MALP2|nr:glucosamine-6-phosphate deaminase [Malacoplasma penetrans]Q8EWM7.1 RecName: Full=Glucosamine-6-phosphate deaminase; AltName: Full=GlcN6P deaminase; Short=GNPDA; AltName: Full=Glucosamine-6-phosphate isomerase [Malacoplasma penetrans HF-2]RXY96971.1 glucosamine-6-phosphate deaminase [Malacoplasma penetrans]BAC43967.1 N-acetylglucosamine 6-phosphate isomerase [Malacoplasma penetrans HF-2]